MVRRVPAGFTLLELLVTLVIIGILAAALIPAMVTGRELARATVCRGNLRHMAVAALAYAAANDDVLPPAHARDYNSHETTSWEAFLWDYDARFANDMKVHQCPSFKGSAMWAGDRYTGYNYNASYLGGTRSIYNGKIESDSKRSAALYDIRDPRNCAMFGDGQYESGANKFMRSPFPGPLDHDSGTALAGTQGFRHRGATNAAFVDGSVRPLKECFTKSGGRGKPAQGCGFLSEDNSLYDYD